jgi:hypothetical protein
MSDSSISAAGLHRDMEAMGFSDLDCTRETGYENPLDVKAPEIHHRYNPSLAQPTISFGDSGPGMDEVELKRSRKLFNHKDATDEKNGCFGIGGSLGSAQLTRLQGKSTRLSKKPGGVLLQLTLDYAKILKEDKYEVIVHEATAAWAAYWDKYAVNKEHGTLEILESPKHVVEALVSAIPGAKFGRMYADYLNEGTKMSIFVDDEKLMDLQAEDVSDKKNASRFSEYDVTIWGKYPEGSTKTKDIKDVLVQYVNGFGKSVYQDPVTGNQVEEDPAAKGYTMLAPIKCTSSVRFKKGATDNWKVEDGGQYPKRVRKVIERFEIPYPSGGDFELREIIAIARHLWNYPTILDPFMGTEINKSRINKAKIHSGILKVLEELADKFSKKYWNDIKPEKKSGVKVASPTPTKKILGRGGKTVVLSSGTTATGTTTTTTPATTTTATTTTATTTTAPAGTASTGTGTATLPTNTLVTGKQTFIPVPAHQKLAPQSQHDLVLAMKEVKAKLNATNLDALLDEAVVTSEGGIANMISTVRDAVKMLEDIAKVKAKPKQVK